MSDPRQDDRQDPTDDAPTGPAAEGGSVEADAHADEVDPEREYIDPTGG